MTDDVNWCDNPLENSPPVRGSGNFLKDRGYADPEGMRERFMLANEAAHLLEAMPADALAEACTATGMLPELAARVVNGVVSDASTEQVKALLGALRVRHDSGVDVVSVS